MSNEVKILVVDDDKSLNETIAMILSSFGYHVATAITAEAGLEIIPAYEPALVLLDGHLPGMSGTQAIAQLKEEKFPGILVGMSAEDREAEMLQAGATFFFAKPFEVPHFLKEMNLLLSETSFSAPL